MRSRHSVVLLSLILSAYAQAATYHIDGRRPPYTNAEGTLPDQTGMILTQIKLPTGNATDDAFANKGITIWSGTGVGQSTKIESYNAGTQVATVNPPWTVQPGTGAQYFISYGSDTYDGTAAEWQGGTVGPWQNVKQCNTIASGTHTFTIYGPATYYEPQTDGNRYINVGATGVNWTFQTGGGTVTMQLSRPAAALNLLGSAGTAYTFSGSADAPLIVINNGSSTSHGIVSGTAADVTLNYCTVSSRGGSGTGYAVVLDGTTASARTCTISNSTLYSNTTCLQSRSAQSITISNTVFDCGTGSGYHIADVAQDPTNRPSTITISGCTFSGADSSSSSVAAIRCLYPADSGMLRVTGNTFLSGRRSIYVPGYGSSRMHVEITDNKITHDGSNGIAVIDIQAGTEADVTTTTLGSVYIARNHIRRTGGQATDAATGIYVCNIGPSFQGATRARDGVYQDRAVVEHNIVYMNESATANTIAIYFRHSNSFVCRHNAIRSQCGIAATEPDHGYIAHNTIYQVGGSSSMGAVHVRDNNSPGSSLGRLSHEDNTANTVDDYWYDPRYVTITDNIIHSAVGQCLYLSTHSSGTRKLVKEGWLIDRNVYYVTGSAAVAYIDKTSYGTLTDLRNFWQSYTGTTANNPEGARSDSAWLPRLRRNDQNSRNDNPMLMDLSKPDLRLSPKSPLLGLDDYMWMNWGAWQRGPVKQKRPLWYRVYPREEEPEE